MSDSYLFMSAGVFPYEGVRDHTCQYIIDSAKRQNIDLHWYGMNTPEYPGWVSIKLEMPIAFLENRTEEYVFYTDGQDAFFTGSREEIIEKYEDLGKPDLLTSATRAMFPHEADISYYDETLGEYRYPHVGGYMGKRTIVIDLFKRLLAMAKSHNWGDDANCWYQAWTEGWFRPEIDSQCQIFQLGGSVFDADLELKNDRLYNKVTESYPCVIHISGGYSDPKEGKLSTVKPWFEKIYET